MNKNIENIFMIRQIDITLEFQTDNTVEFERCNRTILDFPSYINTQGDVMF